MSCSMPRERVRGVRPWANPGPAYIFTVRLGRRRGDGGGEGGLPRRPCISEAPNKLTVESTHDLTSPGNGFLACQGASP